MGDPDTRSIPDCDGKIWKKGEHIATLAARPRAAEDWVKKIAAQANAHVDWHYFGGRACVKFLGNRAARDRVFEAIDALEDELDGRILRTFGPNDLPARGELPFSFFAK